MKGKNVSIIGGGAAGFFAAIHLAELMPHAIINIYEKSNQVLSKVKVSGGGRCNVTHSCFIPSELVSNYPRGNKELRGPFNKFGPAEIIDWFSKRGVTLKTENDGRIFPSTDSSQTIIDTFLEVTRKHHITIHLQKALVDITETTTGWCLDFADGSKVNSKAIFMAPGSSNKLWELLAGKGIEVIPPVPSLFTFHIKDPRLHAMSGVSISPVEITIEDTKFSSEGPLLITHWGLSGPAVLKLSSLAARHLAEKEYSFRCTINFLPEFDDITGELLRFKTTNTKKQVHSLVPFAKISKRLWSYFLQKAGIVPTLNWADISNKSIQQLADELEKGQYPVKGKSTFKEEFVTSGGIDLKEINFTDFSIKKLKGIYAGGEFINVDAITGGFNFQHAWTSGYLAAEGIANFIKR